VSLRGRSRVAPVYSWLGVDVGYSSRAETHRPTD
jgi:hypothetical protein